MKYWTCNYTITLKLRLGVTQGHRNRHGSIRRLGIPINVPATMGLFRAVSKINGDFSRKSSTFRTPVYFAPQLRGFLLELGTGGAGQKTRMMGLQG